MVVGFICNQCLSPLTLWVQILIRRGLLNTTLCDKVCQWLATGWWFSLGTPVSSINKTDCHDINETLLKVSLNTIKQTNKLRHCKLISDLFFYSIYVKNISRNCQVGVAYLRDWKLRHILVALNLAVCFRQYINLIQWYVF